MFGSSYYGPISSYLETSKIYGKTVYWNKQVAFDSSVQRLLGYSALCLESR